MGCLSAALFAGGLWLCQQSHCRSAITRLKCNEVRPPRGARLAPIGKEEVILGSHPARVRLGSISTGRPLVPPSAFDSTADIWGAAMILTPCPALCSLRRSPIERADERGRDQLLGRRRSKGPRAIADNPVLWPGGIA
jgi:hypothetical protein